MQLFYGSIIYGKNLIIYKIYCIIFSLIDKINEVAEKGHSKKTRPHGRTLKNGFEYDGHVFDFRQFFIERYQ